MTLERERRPQRSAVTKSNLYAWVEATWRALCMLLACGGILLLSACGDKPVVVTSIDTLCAVTTRYHATEGQTAAFKADKALWEPLVDWLLSFNKERDKRCLQPARGA